MSGTQKSHEKALAALTPATNIESGAGTLRGSSEFYKQKYGYYPQTGEVLSIEAAMAFADDFARSVRSAARKECAEIVREHEKRHPVPTSHLKHICSDEIASAIEKLKEE